MDATNTRRGDADEENRRSARARKANRENTGETDE